MHRAFTESGLDRGVSDYVIETGAAASPIIGRLVDKGLHDELTGEAYAVIDGTDGRAHHVRFRGVEAFEHAPPPGGIVEVRRFGGDNDQRPTLAPGQPLGHRPCQAGDSAGRDLARSPPGRARAHAAFHGRVRTRGPRGNDGPSRSPRRRRLRPPAGTAHHPPARSSRHLAAARIGWRRGRAVS